MSMLGSASLEDSVNWVTNVVVDRPAVSHWTRIMSVPDWAHGGRFLFDTIALSTGSSSLVYSNGYFTNSSSSTLVCTLSWLAVLGLLPVNGQVQVAVNVLPTTGAMIRYANQYFTTLPG